MSRIAAVLDASVTATWLLPDEASDASRSVFVMMRRGLAVFHAPELWLWECGNIIANGVKRSRIGPDDAWLVWSVLDTIRADVRLSNLEPIEARSALALALDNALSIYDAAYLWLADSLKLPLLSHDKALTAAATRNGVSVLRLEDLS